MNTLKKFKVLSRPVILCSRCGSPKTKRLFGHAIKNEEPAHKCLACEKHFGHNCPY